MTSNDGVTLRWKPGKDPAAFRATLGDLEQAVDEQMKRAMGEAALLVEAKAKRYAPVDTGLLRSDIAHVVEQVARHTLKAFVGNNVEYAPVQEMVHNPYLSVALEESKPEIKRLFEEALEAAVREAS